MRLGSDFYYSILLARSKLHEWQIALEYDSLGAIEPRVRFLILNRKGFLCVL